MIVDHSIKYRHLRVKVQLLSVDYLCVTPQRIYSCAHVHLPLIMLLRTATALLAVCVLYFMESLSLLHL